jgi:hypothetical protein
LRARTGCPDPSFRDLARLPLSTEAADVTHLKDRRVLAERRIDARTSFMCPGALSRSGYATGLYRTLHAAYDKAVIGETAVAARVGLNRNWQASATGRRDTGPATKKANPG